MGILSRAEWQRRYAERVRLRAGWSPEDAAECARVGAAVYEEAQRAAGTEVVFAATPDSTPESEADEEMSCWSDDGEG